MMNSAQEARKQSERNSSKWTIWDTIQERKIDRQIKSAIRNNVNHVDVYNLRENVAKKLVIEDGYGICTHKCFGLTWNEIQW